LVCPTAVLNVPCGDTFELSGPFGIAPNSLNVHPVASQYTDLRYPDTQTCIPNKHSEKLSLILTSELRGADSMSYVEGKGKAVPLQTWSGPEGSKKLRFPDFMTTAQDGGKVVSLTHQPPLPQEMLLVLISVRG